MSADLIRKICAQAGFPYYFIFQCEGCDRIIHIRRAGTFLTKEEGVGDALLYGWQYDLESGCWMCPACAEEASA